MKKLFAMLLALAMALACASGVAETAAEPETWYSLNESEEIVTVRLPANATTGYEWTYEISDPAKLEVVSAEYIPDENREPADRRGRNPTWLPSAAHSRNSASHP